MIEYGEILFDAIVHESNARLMGYKVKEEESELLVLAKVSFTRNKLLKNRYQMINIWSVL